MDFRTWFKGHGADNDLKFEVERLRRENNELETRGANLQIFYDDQSDQMIELKKELAQYKTSLNSFFTDSGDKQYDFEEKLRLSLLREQQALAKIEQLTQELELMRAPVEKKKKKKNEAM